MDGLSCGLIVTVLQFCVWGQFPKGSTGYTRTNDLNRFFDALRRVNRGWRRAGRALLLHVVLGALESDVAVYRRVEFGSLMTPKRKAAMWGPEAPMPMVNGALLLGLEALLTGVDAADTRAKQLQWHGAVTARLTPFAGGTQWDLHLANCYFERLNLQFGLVRPAREETPGRVLVCFIFGAGSRLNRIPVESMLDNLLVVYGAAGEAAILLLARFSPSSSDIFSFKTPVSRSRHISPFCHSDIASHLPRYTSRSEAEARALEAPVPFFGAV
jgi:hypothetical protein